MSHPVSVGTIDNVLPMFSPDESEATIEALRVELPELIARNLKVISHLEKSEDRERVSQRLSELREQLNELYQRVAQRNDEMGVATTLHKFSEQVKHGN